MTDPTDDLIREQIRTSYPLRQSDSSASATLDSLRPQMKRARSRRRATQATVVVVGASLLVIGLLAILPTFGDSPTELNLAGTTTTAPVRDETTPIDEASTTDVGPTTTAPPTSSASPTSTETPAPPETTDQPSTSATPVTTDPPATTEPVSNIITSPCGTVEVALAGAGIALVSTDPNTGFDAEIEKNGPTEVEVRFESAERRCEVSAENRDGQVWSEVDNDLD